MKQDIVFVRKRKCNRCGKVFKTKENYFSCNSCRVVNNTKKYAEGWK